MATMVKAEVLKPFIGNYSDDDDKNNTRTGERRFSNAQGIIPRGFYHPQKRHMVKPHIIELTAQRFKELSETGLVRAYDEGLFKDQVLVGKEATNRPVQINKVPPETNIVSKGGKVA